MKALTQQEIARLLDATTDTRLRTMILVAFRHGMRASEICELERADIDLAGGSILVRRGKRSLTTRQPLGDDEKEALALTLSQSPRSPYAFPMPSGTPINRRTFWRQFRTACLVAGIPADKSHPHALKHGLGRALVAANVNLAVIKQALGHKSIKSTAIYTEIDDDIAGQIVQQALQIPRGGNSAQ